MKQISRLEVVLAEQKRTEKMISGNYRKKGKEKVSKLQADKKAITEYDEFNKTQKIISDFDKHIKSNYELRDEKGI
jgi:hypothetical protein